MRNTEKMSRGEWRRLTVREARQKLIKDFFGDTSYQNVNQNEQDKLVSQIAQAIFQSDIMPHERYALMNVYGLTDNAPDDLADIHHDIARNMRHLLLSKNAFDDKYRGQHARKMAQRALAKVRNQIDSDQLSSISGSSTQGVGLDVPWLLSLDANRYTTIVDWSHLVYSVYGERIIPMNEENLLRLEKRINEIRSSIEAGNVSPMQSAALSERYNLFEQNSRPYTPSEIADEVTLRTSTFAVAPLDMELHP